MGPCGEGARWRAYTHDEELRETGSDNAPFRDFPNCGPDFTRKQYDSRVIRYYEDATQLSRAVNQGTDPIDAPITARMARCGVDLVGFDFLRRGDPRLAALVWSWAPGQPASSGDCAVQRFDGRWAARPCAERHRVACRDAQGDWFVPAARTVARAAPRICASTRVVNGVPRTGFDGQQLRSAHAKARLGRASGSASAAAARAGPASRRRAAARRSRGRPSAAACAAWWPRSS